MTFPFFSIFFFLCYKTFNNVQFYAVKLIGNGLVLFAGLMFLVSPENFLVVFWGRFIAGVGHGITYIGLIEHYGEVTSFERRGRMGASIHLFFLKGGLLSGPVFIEFFNQEEGQHYMNYNRILGITTTSICMISILMIILFYKESPIVLLRSGKDVECRNMLKLLSTTISNENKITKQFNELKCRIEEDDKFSNASIFDSENRHRLLVVVLLRFAFVLTFNYAMKKYIHVTLEHDTQQNSIVPTAFILNLVHTLTVVFALFTIDKRGKRMYFLISSFSSSIIYIILGACSVFELVSTFHNFVIAIFVAFEISSGVGLGITANIYSTEAFGTLKQAGSVAFTCIFEQSLQVIFIVWGTTNINGYSSALLNVILLLSSGSVLLAISIYMFLYLPLETKHLSLREARNSFNNKPNYSSNT
jgi:hypothetical protein